MHFVVNLNSEMHLFIVLAEVTLGNLIRDTLELSGVLENLLALLHS